MHGWRTKLFLCACALLTCLLFTGCSYKFAVSPEDLYSLPQLPPEYTELNNYIQELLEGGAEYATPTSGTNIQPVQLADLNGDGQQEALAFLRNTSDEKPLKIYIFSLQGQHYVQWAVIEGSGTAISSIIYSDLDQNGKLELVIGWKVGSELQTLTVYSLEKEEPRELMRTNYVKYTITDLNQDGVQELIVLHADEEGEGVADYYTWAQNTNSLTPALTLTSTARLSVTMAELNSGRVTRGTLNDQTPALFVTGVSETSTAITDILTVKQRGLANITLSDTTGVSTEIYRYLSLFPSDINNDGITEIPIAVSVPPLTAGEDVYYRIDWHDYDQSGQSSTVQMTYHDMENGWFLTMPEAWRGRILITRMQTSADETMVTLAYRAELEDVPRAFLTIYTMSGENREVRALRGNRFILRRQAETVYAAELLEGNQDWTDGLTEDEVRTSFNLITKEWSSGEN